MNSGASDTEHTISSDNVSDSVLVGLDRLFDASHMRHQFAQWLAESSGEITSCHIVYVRYKPATNCIVAYKLWRSTQTASRTETLCYAKVFPEREFTDACEKVTAKRWRSPDGAKGVYPVPECRAILYRFPNDAALAGLRSLCAPKKLQRVLYRYLPEYPEGVWRISDSKLRYEVVAYKPERRAVLRVSTKATRRSTGEKHRLSFYLRFYADDSGENVIRQLQALRAGHNATESLITPEPICYLAESRALLLRDIAGVPLSEKTDPGEVLRFTELAAKALAIVHGLTVETDRLPAEDELGQQLKQSLAETASTLGALAPGSCQQIATLHAQLDDLSDRLLRRRSLIHGDFHPGQVICQENRVGLIDFDRAQTGSPLSDLANFIAHMSWRSLTNSSIDVSAIKESLISAYERSATVTIDRRELSGWIACRMFFLAVGPFRAFSPQWRQTLLELLELSREELR